MPETVGPTRSAAARHLLLVLLLALAFVAYVYATQSARSAIPDHGDWWTDTYHILAARNLSRYGFQALRFAQTVDDGPQIGLPPLYLPHHPSFPAIVLGLLYRLGLSTTQARIVPLLVASSALVAVYLLVSRMLGDWRAGLLALLALAAAAPFRLLSDSFAYLSYDLAAKSWTLLAITQAGLAASRRRRLWLFASGAGAFLTITLSGFEMVPAIAAYSLLFPLFFAPGDRRARLRSTLAGGACVGAALGLGLLVRLAHNTWILGSWRLAIDDLVGAYLKRSSTTQFGLRQVYWLVAQRAWAYYSTHLLLIAAGLASAGLLAAQRCYVERAGDGRAMRWLAMVFVVENLWYLAFRQHAYYHIHLQVHLALTMVLGVTLAAIAMWRVLARLRPWRTLALAAGGTVLIASLTNVIVGPLSAPWGGGNLLVHRHWGGRQRQIDILASVLPRDAVVDIKVWDDDPSTALLLGRDFVQRPGPAGLPDTPGRAQYLLTYADREGEGFRSALAGERLVALTAQLALFEVGAGPGTLNALAADPGLMSARWADDLGLYACEVQPPARLALPPGVGSELALYVRRATPATGEPAGSAPEIAFSLSTAGKETSLNAVSVDPASASGNRGWRLLRVAIPASDAPRELLIDLVVADGGSSGPFWIAPVTERLD